ncbi:MAG: hypothetical protein RIQ53_1075 [Pseudomonadota bacterium]
MRLFHYAAPRRVYQLAGQLQPWLWATAALCGVAGLVLGFVIAPPDAVQGEVYRILFLHVPAAWLSMLLYLSMAFWAGLGWALRARAASLMARAIAPTGAVHTAVALWTGALWGQPTWGTWWVWDARLTSELLLLFLYLGWMALVQALDDQPERADAAGALLALVGAVNVPVIYFSVRWWNTLHQGASISLEAAPRMAATMLAALALCTLACWAAALAVVLMRCRALLLERDGHARWVQALRAPAHGRPRRPEPATTTPAPATASHSARMETC